MVDVILIPWRPGDPFRERNLRIVLEWYAPLMLPVYYGDTDHETFNRGAARNAAAAAAGEWEQALILDADCLAELDVVREAFACARLTKGLVIPHDDFWRFTKEGTAQLSTNMALIERPERLAGLRYNRPAAPSGALVLTREAFEAIGRYDERFIGWGYEDSAFLRDAERVVGVTRLPGRLYHLWHPRDSAGAAEHNEWLASEHPRE